MAKGTEELISIAWD